MSHHPTSRSGRKSAERRRVAHVSIGRGMAALFAGAALLLATMAGGAALQAAVGELVVLKGEATVIRGERRIAVRRGYVLEDADRVKTGKDSKVHIRLYAPLDGSDVVATQDSEFSVHELTRGSRRPVFSLIWGAIRSRLRAFTGASAYMRTGTAVIGVKGTDFIVYVKREQASEFIGVDGLIEARSRSMPEYALRIGRRQWGEIVAGERPKPPVRVPDDQWFAALDEFSFPGEPAPQAPQSE